MMNSYHNITIQADVLDQLPPIYKAAILPMIKSYNAYNYLSFEDDILLKFKILQNFGTKFVLLSQQWEIYDTLVYNLRTFNIEIPQLRRQKILGFYSEIYNADERLILGETNEKILQTLNFKKWHNILYYPEKLICTPHWNLKDTKHQLKENCAKEIPKKILQKYERTKFLYEKFVSDHISDDEWIQYLNELKDEEVIIGLFEHRLGWKKGCFNKDLWKLYMKFLKDKNQIAYLNLYRRYTRFYIEDKQMVEEYRNEIDRISKISKIPVSEFWIDTILYEFDFGTKDTAKKIFARALATILPNIWPNQNLNIEIPHFPALPTVYQNYLEIISKSDASKNFKPMLSDPLKAPKKLPLSCYFPKAEIPVLKRTQNFSIPRNLIFYITQNSKCNHQMLKKFYNCCKYFFAIQPTPLCYRLVLGWKEASKYIDESLFLNDKDLDFIGLDNLYITSSLDVITSKPKTLSNTIPKLYKCEAKYGRIDNQEINVNELEYLYYSLFPNGHINAICSYIVRDDVKEKYYIDVLKDLFPNKL